MKMLISSIAFLFLLSSCSVHPPQRIGMNFEKHSSLEPSPFNAQRLSKLTPYLQTEAATTGMLVLYEGKVIFEYGDVQEVSYIASCRKSVLSMLYGKHVADGTIDLDQNIGDLGIEESDGLLSKEKEARVDHIITSRSGVFHIAANGGYDKENFLRRGSVEPGDYFVYNNWDFNVAGYILEKQSGNSVYQELEKQLAIPLGFQDWNINNQKKKHKKKNAQYPAYLMYLSTRDMAKIGQLMLQEGNWNGSQLIPKEWIKKTTTTITPANIINERYGTPDPDDIQLSYGYMWWLIDHFRKNKNYQGAYSACGFGGQFISIFPAQKLVVAHKSKLKLLAQWGLRPGGTSNYTYWEIIDLLMNAIEE